jgi:hypothetical protein
MGVFAGMLIATGETGRGQELLQQLGDGQEYGAAMAFLLHYLFRGDVDQVAHWARRAIDQHDLTIPFLLRVPLADPLRASSHWPALAQAMNLADTVS